jgi:cation:H+ antiporter
VRHVLTALAGLVILITGGRLLVDAAVATASAFGISDLVIGLTIVAIGTSLPEMATTLIAAWRGHGDLAVGNIVGSNILNIFAVLGLTAAIQPINARPEIFHLEIPIMLVFSVGLLFLVFRGRRLVRWQGIMLTVGYIAFVMILLGRGTV